MDEFALIDRIRARAGTAAGVELGIGDDAALLRPSPGQLLAVATDTLNAGVHFPETTAAADIGHKALAVNLSDLAAMGASPEWCTLALSLPDADAAFVDAFLDGFLGLAERHAVVLVGGDTTRGPLSVTVTVGGRVPPGAALRRDGARVGDAVFVTGTLGDAAAGLRQVLDAADPTAVSGPLRQRLDRPTPRLAAGLTLRGQASACIDLSDGLLGDLGHVLAASGVGAELALAALPVSPALAAVAKGPALWQLQLCGGDDFELCFTAPEAAEAAIAAAMAATGTPVARVGRIVPGGGLALRTPDGADFTPSGTAWRHFRGADA